MNWNLFEYSWDECFMAVNLFGLEDDYFYNNFCCYKVPVFSHRDHCGRLRACEVRILEGWSIGTFLWAGASTDPQLFEDVIGLLLG